MSLWDQTKSRFHYIPRGLNATATTPSDVTLGNLTSGNSSSSNLPEPSLADNIASAVSTTKKALKPAAKLTTWGANEYLKNVIDEAGTVSGLPDNIPGASLASSYLGEGLFNPNIYDPALVSGTSVGADLGNIGSEISAAQSGTTSGALGMAKKVTPWLGAGLGLYDMVANKPKGSHAMADFGAIAALANPALGLAFAAPAILGSLFGGKSKPDFYAHPENRLAGEYGEDGNYYISNQPKYGIGDFEIKPGAQGTFRFNPEQNRWEYPIIDYYNMPDQSETGYSENPYITGWQVADIVNYNGELYLKESGHARGDYWNLSGINAMLPENYNFDSELIPWDIYTGVPSSVGSLENHAWRPWENTDGEGGA